MASREDLGADWTEIIAKWYLGRSPNITAEDGWAALGAVGRLWPERISSLTARANRGSIIFAPEVDLGITLLACEHLPGFDAVLDRMKQGERSAATEAYVLAALIRAGYSVLVEPKVGGKKPDAAVQIDSELVYIEVVVPDESAEHQRVASRLGGLADRLLDQHPGVSMDVFLLVEPTIEVADSICDLVERAAAAPDGKVHELPGVGFAQVMPFLDSIALPLTLPDPPDPGIPDLPSTGVLSFGFGSEGQVLAGQVLVSSSRAYVQLPFTDVRAQRLMENEAHHFARDAMSILVMDISTVGGGRRGWPPLIQRRFQPALNRRFGAVVLFDSRLGDTGVTRKWVTLPNLHAERTLPERLLADFATQGR